jgi:hypothetical protein
MARYFLQQPSYSSLKMDSASRRHSTGNGVRTATCVCMLQARDVGLGTGGAKLTTLSDPAHLLRLLQQHYQVPIERTSQVLQSSGAEVYYRRHIIFIPCALLTSFFVSLRHVLCNRENRHVWRWKRIPWDRSGTLLPCNDSFHLALPCHLVPYSENSIGC